MSRRRSLLVLGAHGHLGGLVVAATREERELDVRGAARHPREGEVRVDLCDAATFGALREFDVVINAADSSTAPPDGAARAVLEAGGVWLETSADPEVFRRLMAYAVDGPGALVLGAGAFPGLSTHLLEAAPAGASLEFRASWSVLSAAGKGTVGVMVDALSADSLVLRGGEAVATAPLAPIGRRLVDGRRRNVVALALPDVLLAGRRGHPDAVFFAAVRPALPKAALSLVSAAGHSGLLGWRPTRTLAGLGLSVLRRGLLRGRTTPLRIELHEAGGEGAPLAAVECRDAFGAGARAAAALAARWPLGLAGARLPEEGLPLAELAALLQGHATFEVAGRNLAG